ncbi:MAG TPA: transcriptional repressor [Bryobacteraceae bacterium]|nr:transcriptional repressor [Bryobacteraceae bacterium]
MHPAPTVRIQPGMDVEQKMQWFRTRCVEAGLPCTHQRQVLYRALLEAADHPSPEMLYERVKRDIPSVSLGTVYRNIKTFLDNGLIGEVNLHHRSLRLEANNAPHHHLICRVCRKMFDLPVEQVEGLRLRDALPAGFHLERFVVEAHGLCAACAAPKAQRSSSRTSYAKNS